jgi:hypothetical protein
MAWIFIVLAGLDGIGRPICLKLGWIEHHAQPLWMGFGSVCMAIGALIPVLRPTEIPNLGLCRATGGDRLGE